MTGIRVQRPAVNLRSLDIESGKGLTQCVDTRQNGRVPGTTHTVGDIGRIVADVEEMSARGNSPYGFGQPVAAFLWAGVQVDDGHKIKGCRRQHNRGCIVDPEVHIDIAMPGQCQRLADSFLGIVNSRDPPSVFGKIQRVSPLTAAKIERTARLELTDDFSKQTVRSRGPHQFFGRVAFVPCLFIRHGNENNGRIPAMQNISFSDVTGIKTPAPDKRLNYGTGAFQFGEYWQADPARRRGLIMFIHGGCWQSAYGVDHSRPLVSTLREHGFAVFAIEYRRLGDPGGGWPGTFEDVGVATDFTQRLRDRREPVIYMGHSAGGHLALWSAVRSKLPKDSSLRSRTRKPDAVISLAGIVDLSRYARGRSSCEQSAAALMGGLPEEHEERYALADPARIAIPRNAHFLTGTEDSIIPANQLDDISESPRVIDGAGHFDFIHPQTSAFHALVTLLAEIA